MKLYTKIFVPLFIVLFSLVSAQGNTPGAPCMECPEQANPIDMYVYALGVVAVLMIAFFTKKYKVNKI